jgi:hypothetical protein
MYLYNKNGYFRKYGVKMYLYFISDSKNIKVGIAKDVNKRIKSLQTGNPYNLKIYRIVEIPDAYARTIEHDMHCYLYQYKLTGEWFDGKCKKLIDMLSNNDIYNNIIGEKVADNDTSYLYKISDTEVSKYIITRYKIIFLKDGSARYASNKGLSKYDPELKDILSNLDNQKKYPIYTLDKSRATEYGKKVAIKNIDYINSKIKKHYNAIDMLTEEINKLQNFVGE